MQLARSDFEDMLMFIAAASLTAPGNKLYPQALNFSQPSAFGGQVEQGFHLPSFLSPKLAPLWHAVLGYGLFRLFQSFGLGSRMGAFNLAEAASYVGVEADRARASRQVASSKRRVASDAEAQAARARLAAKIAQAKRVSADLRNNHLSGRKPMGHTI